MGCWIFGYASKSVDKYVAGYLHAEGHVGVVVAARIMPAGLVRAGLEIALWRGSAFSGTDPRVKDKPRSLPRLKALFREVDHGALAGTDDLE